MTSSTVHHINIRDMTTLRLTCEHCQVVTVVNVDTWNPHASVGTVVCPHCAHPWGKSIATLLEVLRAIRRGANGVTMQVELVA